MTGFGQSIACSNQCWGASACCGTIVVILHAMHWPLSHILDLTLRNTAEIGTIGHRDFFLARFCLVIHRLSWDQHVIVCAFPSSVLQSTLSVFLQTWLSAFIVYSVTVCILYRASYAVKLESLSKLRTNKLQSFPTEWALRCSRCHTVIIPQIDHRGWRLQCDRSILQTLWVDTMALNLIWLIILPFWFLDILFRASLRCIWRPELEIRQWFVWLAEMVGQFFGLWVHLVEMAHFEW